MTGEDLAAVVGFGSLALSFAGLIFVAIQVRLLRVQISDTRMSFEAEQRRGRRQSSLEFIAATMERRATLQNAIPDGGDLAAVSDFLAELDRESGTQEKRRDLNRFLSYYESAAVGVNSEVFDIEIIDRAWGSVIMRTFNAYREYIVERRRQRDQPRLFAEFEQLALSIRQRRGESSPSALVSVPKGRSEIA